MKKYIISRFPLLLWVGIFLLIPFCLADSLVEQQTKKQEGKVHFIYFMLPSIQKANQRLSTLRGRVLHLCRTQYKLGTRTRDWLTKLARRYRLLLDFKQNRDCHLLLERLDIVPVSIILAQAINESAWGTSRFAREGYNFFGQWCYRKGCGMKPLQARKLPHEVARFKSVFASVVSYLHNINTHPAYQKFRHLRFRMRQTSDSLEIDNLLVGLLPYSSLREQYVSRIRRIIKRYQLERFDAIVLS